MSERASQQTERILAYVLIFTGAASVVFVALGMVPTVRALVPSGPFHTLARAYGPLVWWLPLYVLALGVIALRPSNLNWRRVVGISALHPPVLTVALLWQLAMLWRSITLDTATASPLARGLIDAFDRSGAMLVTGAVLVCEVLLIVVVWRWVERKPSVTERAASRPDTDRSDHRSAIPLPAVRGGAGEPKAQERSVVERSTERTTPDPQDLPRWVSEALESGGAVPEATEKSMLESIPEASALPVDETQPIVLKLRARHEQPAHDQVDRHSPKFEVDVELIEDEIILALDDQADHHGPESEADVKLIEDEIVLALDDRAPDDAGYEDERSVDEPVEEPAPERIATHRRYELDPAGLLRAYQAEPYWEVDDRTRDSAEVLRVTLKEFGITAEVTGIRKGPVITMFEILPAPGVKLARITNLADNIALRLAAQSVRIVAPIPGKHAVGIEIPNAHRAIVGFGELIQAEEFWSDGMQIPIALGKDIAGEAQIQDLTRLPHMLIAGATGSGKSVCVNSIICSILFRRAPSEVKLILIDPKIVELKFYNDIPHLLTPVITDPKRAFQALQYLIYEMERRYTLLDSVGARDLVSYNTKVQRRRLATEALPYIAVVIDEFADLIATSGKELESTVARLAAMSRAVGIHLVLATQRPSTDVITGLIKANIPARIAFMVASKVDSRIITDAVGAEKLLGRGDMLFTSAADPVPARVQGAFLSEDEVECVVERVKQFGAPDYIDDEIFLEEDDPDYVGDQLEDPLMERAIEIVTQAGRASASYLQRRLKIGYNRAARMVEEMEHLGIVGPQNGSKPRDVLHV